MGISRLIHYTLNLIVKNSPKYSDTPEIRHLHNDVYDPIFIQIQPFFRNYQDNNSMARTLFECRKLLESNHNIVNPVYITRINKIISKNGKFKRSKNLTCKEKFLYLKSNRKRRKKISSSYRKDNFYYFVHEFINDYNKLRKALGLPTYNLTQRILIDQISYNNWAPLICIIAFSFVILGIYIIIIGLSTILN